MLTRAIGPMPSAGDAQQGVAQFEALQTAQMETGDVAIATAGVVTSAWSQIAASTETMTDDVIVVFANMVVQVVSLIRQISAAQDRFEPTGALGALGGIGIAATLIGGLVSATAQSRRRANDRIQREPRFIRGAR